MADLQADTARVNDMRPCLGMLSGMGYREAGKKRERDQFGCNFF